MSYIRFKKFGKKTYAYEVTSFWDSIKKIPRQKVRYLGVVDEKGRIVKKREDREKLILDFGDAYILYEFMKKIGIFKIIEEVFPERISSSLLPLLIFRLSQPSAMRYAKVWFEGSVARILAKEANLSSQRISELLRVLGEEKLLREFFRLYISSIGKSEGIIIDTTALPNQIRLPFNAWGYHDGEIEKQIKFLFVVDGVSSLPIYFRYLAGNLLDVSTLRNTIEELKRMGIKASFVLLDAGFFSRENIEGLKGEGIEFLIRMPSSRKLYKRLIIEEGKELERYENAVRYGKRALFIKEKEVEIYGKRGYAYIVLDPERKGREMKKVILEAMEEGYEGDIDYTLKKQGVMILLSSFKIGKEEVVPYYYLRHKVETLFGYSKDDLQLIPLRTHREETLRGYLLLMFITLVVFMRLKGEVGGRWTVEEILLKMRNMKCKVYDKEVLVQEATKEQKEILKILKILVPKKLGI